MYRETAPSPALQPFVECYWTASGGHPGSSRQKRILPDGCMDIILDFERRETYLVGNMTRHMMVTTAGKVDLLGIRFRPMGFYRLSGVPLHFFNDSRTDTEAVLPGTASGLLERCGNEAHRRVGMVEEVLLREIARQRPIDRPLQRSVDLILSSRGNITVESLGREAGMSCRTMERKFLVHVGLSPKMLCRIVRFRHAAERIQLREGSLMHLAFDTGFTDHAHLGKEILRFAGVSPHVLATGA